MRKALIIGINGSGKTIFAKKSAEKTSISLVHHDKLYWRDNRTHAENEEFDKLPDSELIKDERTIDGNIILFTSTKK